MVRARRHDCYLEEEAAVSGLPAVPLELVPAFLLHAPSSAAAAINISAVSVLMRRLLFQGNEA